MDRCNQLQDHLAQAQRELAEVAARIERQKALIRKLERGGQDTAHAVFLLQQSLGLKHSMRRTGPDYSASWKAWDRHGSRQPGCPLNALRNLDDGLRLVPKGPAVPMPPLSKDHVPVAKGGREITASLLSGLRLKANTCENLPSGRPRRYHRITKLRPMMPRKRFSMCGPSQNSLCSR